MWAVEERLRAAVTRAVAIAASLILAASLASCDEASSDAGRLPQGYWLLRADGAVFGFGSAPHLGDVEGKASSPAVDMAVTPSGRGYWVALANGEVHAFGDAPQLGDVRARADAKIVAIASTPGRGYWLVAADTGVIAFGDARLHGDDRDNPRRESTAAAVDIEGAPQAEGYWVLTDSISGYGRKRPVECTAARHGAADRYREPIRPIGIAALPGPGTRTEPGTGMQSPVGELFGEGRIAVFEDGIIDICGDIEHRGSLFERPFEGPLIGIDLTPDGDGYWVAAANGDAFAFGGASHLGDAKGRTKDHPIVAIAAVP